MVFIYHMLTVDVEWIEYYIFPYFSLTDMWVFSTSLLFVIYFLFCVYSICVYCLYYVEIHLLFTYFLGNKFPRVDTYSSISGTKKYILISFIFIMYNVRKCNYRNTIFSLPILIFIRNMFYRYSSLKGENYVNNAYKKIMHLYLMYEYEP